MQNVTRSGGMCDAAFYANGLYVVTMAAGEVVVAQWASDDFAPIFRAPCEGNGFPRLGTKSNFGPGPTMFAGQVFGSGPSRKF